MIGRRLPASSSFVLAAARLRALQLDPGRATAQTGSHEEKPQHSPPQTPAAKAQVTGSDHHTLLTAKAPMGADLQWQVMGSNHRNLSRRFYREPPSAALKSIYLRERRPGSICDRRSTTPQPQTSATRWVATGRHRTHGAGLAARCGPAHDRQVTLGTFCPDGVRTECMLGV